MEPADLHRQNYSQPNQLGSTQGSTGGAWGRPVARSQGQEETLGNALRPRAAGQGTQGALGGGLQPIPRAAVTMGDQVHEAP